jgi:hypothetical protein
VEEGREGALQGAMAHELLQREGSREGGAEERHGSILGMRAEDTEREREREFTEKKKHREEETQS